jgi:hypothetical protein
VSKENSKKPTSRDALRYKNGDYSFDESAVVPENWWG